MNLRKILVESFKLLIQSPKLFVPKIVSTTISMVWVLSLAELFTFNFDQISSSTAQYYLVSAPFIVFLGIFVSVMLAEMTTKKPLLKQSFLNTIKKWKSLTATTLFLLLSSVAFYIPAALGLAGWILLNSVILLVAGIILSIILLLAFSFSIYFLPISLVEETSFGESIKESLNASRKSSTEVSLMLLLSFVLLGIAFTMQGNLRQLGIIGFALSRYVSAVTTTYLFVVSPKMYEETKEG